MDQVKFDEYTIKLYINKYFNYSIENLINIKEELPTQVWSFYSNNEKYFLRISYDFKDFWCEKWALMQAQGKNIRVPKVVIQSYFPNETPFIILTGIKGIPLIKSASMKDKENVLVEAGKDLAKLNSIKTKNFGWCCDEKTRENKILSGYDSTCNVIINIALNESLQLLERKKHFSRKESLQIYKYIEEQKEEFYINQGFLVHGDFNSSHIYVLDKGFSGIIDFGNLLSADPIWDIATFSIKNKSSTPILLESWLNQMRLENHGAFQIINEKDLQQRIKFYRVIISLLKSQWIIENTKKKCDDFIKAVKEELI